MSRKGPDGITVRDSATFDTRAEASAWSEKREQEIETGKVAVPLCLTFADLVRRYADSVSPTKPGERWEQVRIAALVRDDPLASVLLIDLDAKHTSAWRDRRLRTVAESTVRREWSLLSGACTVAINEWKWLERNPFAGVRRPRSAPHRDRRISADEIERLTWCLGYEREKPPATATSRAGAAFLWAIETAMRAGEICALQWDDLEIERRFARVRRGKTEAAKRDVPLSSEALRIAGQLAGVRAGPLVFQLRAASLDALFRKAKRRAWLADADLHFHDTRHEGITRLAAVLGVLELARAVGHRDLRMLQMYYNESAEDIAKKLK
ncbi:MAG: site-specific integrase [Candidatus Accumulibacter propinquus]